MSGTEQSTANAITLKGSAQIIAEYLKYGMNSILFQRGIYPAENFDNTQQYGLTILMSKDPKIQDFLEKVLAQAKDWLGNNMVDKVSMIIFNAHTKEVLECWDFHIKAEAPLNASNGTEPNKAESSKELKRIQNEIRDVMRQISATVSYLPLLDCICTFDVLFYTKKDCEVPESWDETSGVVIANGQSVKLRSFSTGLQKVDTVVNFKMNSDNHKDLGHTYTNWIIILTKNAINSSLAKVLTALFFTIKAIISFSTYRLTF